YSITVSNRGPYSASGVFVTNTLPASFAVVSINTSQGTWSPNGNTVIFTIGSMVNGGSVAITSSGTPSTGGTITNKTQVTASSADLNSANNTVNTTTRVNAKPTISSIATQNVNEDSTTSISFTISDAETPAGSLQLAVTSSNPALVPGAGLVLGGAGQNRTLSM